MNNTNLKYRITLSGMAVAAVLLASPSYSLNHKKVGLPDFVVTKFSIVDRKIWRGKCSFKFNFEAKNIGDDYKNINDNFQGKDNGYQITLYKYSSGTLVKEETLRGSFTYGTWNTNQSHSRNVFIQIPQNGAYKAELIISKSQTITEKSYTNNSKSIKFTKTENSCYMDKIQGVPKQKTQVNSIPRKPGKLMPRPQGKLINKIPPG